MPKAWAISGVDLHIPVPPTHVRAGLEDALRDAIRTGRLPAGTRLPSSRQLAADLGLARNTVAEAYGQLVAEGWLVARRGSGTRVAAPTSTVVDEPVITAAAHQPRYDLRPGMPNLAAFPVSTWTAALRRALTSAPASTLGYSDPRGTVELRTALTTYLARARGVRTHPDRIIVCTGFTQGLALLSQVLRERGAGAVAVEAYSQPAHRHVITSRGLHVPAVPVDGSGAATDRLPDADAVLLTAAHQFPLGPSLAPVRRAAVVSWAADTGGLVIEDDYDGEFRYDRHPLGALQSVAADHVAYLGTASKTLVPGVRLGWLVPPRRLLVDLVAAKAAADGHTNTLDQLALADLINTGGYDRHVRRCRLAYRRRRDQLVQALRRHVPGACVTGIAAGLNALVTLPDGVEEAATVARAGDHGLALDGLGGYHHDGPRHAPALVVGYATPPDHAYTGALARLTATLAAEMGRDYRSESVTASRRGSA
jgi:GntR family transcriptional regulator/MocR family aminotransferase